MHYGNRSRIAFFVGIFVLCFFLLGNTEKGSAGLFDFLRKKDGSATSVHAQPLDIRQLRVGEATYPLTLNPFNVRRGVEHRLSGLIYEPLARYDEDGKLEGVTLENWNYDPGSGGSRVNWGLKLREGLQWSDGGPVGSDDLVYTLETISKTKSPFARVYAGARVKPAPDEPRVWLTFGRDITNSPLNKRFFTIPLVRGDSFKGNLDRPVIQTKDRNVLIGTGPFVFDEYREKHGVLRFSRNGQFKGSCYFQEVVVNIVTNRTTLNKALLPSERDGQYIDICSTVPFNFFRMIQSSGKVHDHIRSFVNFSRSVYCIGFNFRGKEPARRIFHQEDFRSALAAGFDKKAVMKSHFGAASAKLRYGPLGRDDILQGLTKSDPNPYDVMKARRLLKGAARDSGMRYSQKAGLTFPDGRPGSYKFAYAVWEPDAKKVFQDFREQMGLLGVRIEPVPISYRDQWSKMLKKGGFDMVYLQLHLGASGNFIPYFIKGGEDNCFGYAAGGSQTYMRRYLEAKSVLKEKRYLVDAANALTEECPAIFLWRLIFNGAIRSDIHTGGKKMLNPFDLFENICEWKIVGG